MNEWRRPNADFRASYRHLDARMRTFAEAEGHVYTPCPEPLGPVDYVFICMEPSLDGRSPVDARARIEAGFRNFLPGGLETSILHFCIRRYLCKPGERYHITDLSKGGMRGKDAGADRIGRYDRWYHFLEEELNLVAKPAASVFAVGVDVDRYLRGRRDFTRPLTRVIHYSPLAGAARAAGIRNHEDAFERFKESVSLEDVVATSKEVLRDYGVPEYVREESLTRLRRYSHLSESSRQLIFDYKLAFEANGVGRAAFLHAQ